MKYSLFGLVILLTGIVTNAFAMEISFSSPTQWMTLRDRDVVVRFHADTSLLPKNQVAFSLNYQTENSSRRILQKTVTLDSFTGEFNLGSVDEYALGGSRWLMLNWSVPGTDYKGEVGPLGIAELEKIGTRRIKGAKRMDNEIASEKVISALGDENFVTVGGTNVSLGWNDKTLFILYDKENSIDGEIHLAIDPKCGKNAFLSWADRFIVYKNGNDSAEGIHYRRVFEDNTVQYNQRLWGDELENFPKENRLLVSIPWSEIGLIPFDERVIGFAAFKFDEDGSSVETLPSGAVRDIPGTWGDIILQK